MQTENSEIFVPDNLYGELVTRLAAVMPLLGDSNHLRITLGEVAGIWPEGCREVTPEAPKLTLAYAS